MGDNRSTKSVINPNLKKRTEEKNRNTWVDESLKKLA